MAQTSRQSWCNYLFIIGGKCIKWIPESKLYFLDAFASFRMNCIFCRCCPIFFIETKFDLVPIVLVSRFDTSRTRFDEIAKLVRRPLHKALVLTGTSPSYSYL